QARIMVPLHPTGIGCVGQSTFLSESWLERHTPDSDDGASQDHHHCCPGDVIQECCPPGPLPKEKQVVNNVPGIGENPASPVRLLNDVVALFRDVVLSTCRVVHRQSMPRNI